jgi:hypothetical protein
MSSDSPNHDSPLSTDFFQVFKDLFKQSFITNCHLDDASVTTEELDTLDELDNLEVLENLKDLLESLLNFKSNVRAESSGELATRCEQLEKMLQKQESEVRAHIRNEHQLKLHLDAMQQKLIDTETNLQEAQNVIKDLESHGHESMNTKLKKIEDRFQGELSKLATQYKTEIGTANVQSERLQKMEGLYEKKEKSFIKLQQDFEKMKGLLYETTKECKALKKEIEKHGAVILSSEALTKRKDEIVEKNFNRVQLINKGKLLDRSRKVMHIKKRSEDFNLHSKFTDPTPPPADSRQHSIVKTSFYHSRKHVRSQSDYSRPMSSKKIYSKH